MSDEELRAALKRYGLSQRAFAFLIGRLPQAVGKWIAGEQPVPGYAASFLAAFELLSPEQRAALLRNRGVWDRRKKTKGHRHDGGLRVLLLAARQRARGAVRGGAGPR
jgi:transcriptional regulator with XRE-family HTH domain